VPAFLFLIAHFLLVLGRFLFRGCRQLMRLQDPNVLKELCGTFCYGYLEQGRHQQKPGWSLFDFEIVRLETGGRTKPLGPATTYSISVRGGRIKAVFLIFIILCFFIVLHFHFQFEFLVGAQIYPKCACCRKTN
jgi:hypothetical protein